MRADNSSVSTRVSVPATALVAGLALTLLCAVSDAAAQIRPPGVDDKPSVKKKDRGVTKRKPKVDARPRARTNGLLVIQTNPGAEVSINGQAPVLADAQGRVVREYPLGQTYLIRVVAGEEFQPFTERVLLKEPQRFVDAELVSKYGSVTIASAPAGASVQVDGKPPAEGTVERVAQALVVKRLLPGKHEIAVLHPDHAPVRASFDVVAGDEFDWTPQFLAALGEIALTSEPGAKVYVDGKYAGDVLGDGTLRVGSLARGPHEVRVTKPGFEDFTATGAVDPKAPLSLAARLVPKASTVELYDDFSGGMSQWVNASAGAAVADRSLTLARVASPVLTRAAYRDFTMTFYVTLKNGAGAAWALRAADPKNYYRFYLSGPAGEVPNRFVVDVVRDGAPDPSRRRVIPMAVKLEPGARFTVEARVQGNTIQHLIKAESSSATADVGVLLPLDNFTDEAGTFAFGSVGFCTVGPESYAVNEVYVVPKK